MDRVLIVAAAGRGSRLGAAGPKALVRVAGQPMLERLLAMHRATVDRVVVVAAPDTLADFERFVAGSGAPVDLAVQAEPTGMLDAVLAARAVVAAWRPRRVAITWCDQIALADRTIARVAARARSAGAPALVFPTFVMDHPYIHFDRNAAGAIVGVRQRREGDEMPERGESDLGLFDLSFGAYDRDLDHFASGPVPAGRTGERNFLPFIPWLAARQTVETVAGESQIETVGINTPEDLRAVQDHLSPGGRPLR
jgi:molybdopterin-guanine dinucleotide biosynthesis protein A